MNTESKLLSVKNAAVYLGVTESALRKRIFDRSIGGLVRIGGSLYFDRKKLDKFIDGAEIKNGGQRNERGGR